MGRPLDDDYLISYLIPPPPPILGFWTHLSPIFIIECHSHLNPLWCISLLQKMIDGSVSFVKWCLWLMRILFLKSFMSYWFITISY